MLHSAKYTMILLHSIQDVFQFFADATNLERITPPQLRFRILSPTPVSMGKGVCIDYSLRLYGIPFRWRAVIGHWQPPFQFVDEQVRGPFRLWVHTHRFFALDRATRIEDEVHYILPFSPLGDIVYPLIHPLIDRIFSFRKNAIESIFR